MTMVATAFDERPLAFFWRFHRFQLLCDLTQDYHESL